MTVLRALLSIRSNPVLRRELDVRARSRVSAVALAVWLVLLGGIASLVYFAYVSSDNSAIDSDNAEIGREIFQWTLFGMMALVLFLVPAFTASSVAGERTRQTLIPVQMTALGPFDIVLGKSLAAIAFTVLLIVAAAPMLAVAFLVGGVTIGDLGAALGMLLLTAVLLGAVGIMLSSLFRTVQAATVLTYGFVAVIAIGSFVALGITAVAINIGDDDNFDNDVPSPLIMAVNPFAGLADAVAEPEVNSFNTPANPIGALRQGIFELDRDRAFDRRFGNGNFVEFGRPPFVEPPFGEPNGDDGIQTQSLWRWYVVFAVVGTYVSLWVASNRLRTPAEVER